MDKTGTLVGLLLARIDSGEYPAGGAVPSERQLGEELGLSRTTVRRAIDDLVQRGLLQRQPGRGTFVSTGIQTFEPAVSAQRIVSVIVPTFSNPYYGEMVNGIEKEARRFNLRIMVGQSDYLVDSESTQLAQAATDPAVCGALVVPDATDKASPGVERLLKAGKRLVYIGRWPEAPSCDGVRVDYRMAARQAVAHLVGLGHERIAYVEGLPRLPGFSPFDGYAEVLKSQGIVPREDLVRTYELPSESAGRQAVLDLVSTGTKFTAIFARNDVTAMGVMQGLRETGLRIPQDVSVVSIANSLWSRSMDPPLTAANPHPEVVGQLALRMLNDRLEGTYTGPAIKTTVTPDLIIRASTSARS